MNIKQKIEKYDKIENLSLLKQNFQEQHQTARAISIGTSIIGAMFFIGFGVPALILKNTKLAEFAGYGALYSGVFVSGFSVACLKLKKALAQCDLRMKSLVNKRNGVAEEIKENESLVNEEFEENEFEEQ